MTRHDDAVTLDQLRAHLRELIDLTAGRTRDELGADRSFTLIVERLLEIVGEAVKRLSPAMKSQAPDIPWSEIVGLRNRLSHGYDEVDYDIVWDTVTLDVPVFIRRVDGLIAVYEGRNGDE